METIKFKVTGTSAMLMNSDRFANPLDPATKAHKELTSKRKKTEDDHAAIARSEWMGSIYFDEELGPYLPSFNLRSCIVEGAKQNRLGSAVERSVLIFEEKLLFKYDGPATREELWADGRFTDARTVVVQGSRLMRYRPMFPKWSLSVEIHFDPAGIERQDLITAFEKAGRLIGLGDFRPAKGGTFGRFAVEVVS